MKQVLRPIPVLVNRRHGLVISCSRVQFQALDYKEGIKYLAHDTFSQGTKHHHYNTLLCQSQGSYLYFTRHYSLLSTVKSVYVCLFFIVHNIITCKWETRNCKCMLNVNVRICFLSMIFLNISGVCEERIVCDGNLRCFQYLWIHVLFISLFYFIRMQKSSLLEFQIMIVYFQFA